MATVVTLLVMFALVILLFFLALRFFLRALGSFRARRFSSGILNLFVAGLVSLPLLFVLSILIPCGGGQLAPRTQCQSNLHQFDLALSSSCYPPNNFYPASLADLDPDDVSPKLFVCPYSGNEPGELADADAWMDYIYVMGQSPATGPGTPIIICPYHEVHEGANILDSDHSTRWRRPVDMVDLLASVASSGHLYKVSDRVMAQSLGRIRSSGEKWVSSALPPLTVSISVDEHRSLIIRPLCHMLMLSFAMFLIGWLCGRRGRRGFKITAVSLSIVAAVLYGLFLADSGLLTHAISGPGVLFYGQSFLPIVCILCGALWTVERGSKRRHLVLSILMVVASMELFQWVLLPRPEMSDIRSDWLSLQTSDKSCSAAACASLLRLQGLDVSEAEMAAASLTTCKGTSWLGMYRGLKILGGRYCEVRSRSFDSSHELTYPAVINVELKKVTPETRDYNEKWGWDVGVRHAVVLHGKTDDGMLLVGDPSVGIERWNMSALDVLWDGEALVVAPKPLGQTRGR